MVKHGTKTFVYLLFIINILLTFFNIQEVGALSLYKPLNSVPVFYPNLVQSFPLDIEIYGNKYPNNARYLDFSHGPLDEKIIDYLALFPNLEKVELMNHDIPLDQMLLLKEKYPYVDFHFGIKIGNNIYDSLANRLDLSYLKVTDFDDLKARLRLFNNLEYVDLSECNLSNEKLGALREEFQNVQIDWMIHLSKWKFKTDVKAFSVLVYSFNYVKITSKDLEVFKYCKNLEALDLGHQNITDISAIAKYLPNLKVLILADNNISDITPLASLTKLHYLELFMNPIHNISALASLKELVDINLCYDRIYDFSPLYNLPLLERIWLVGTGVSGTVISNLRSRFPTARIVYTGGGSTNAGFRTHERYYEMIKMFKDRYYISPSFTKYNGMNNNYVNKTVNVVIDHPVGSTDKDGGFIYLTNFGYLKDDSKVRVHVLGEYNPLNKYVGKVIAIMRSDKESVLIVGKTNYSDEVIKALIDYKQGREKYQIIR